MINEQLSQLKRPEIIKEKAIKKIELKDLGFSYDDVNFVFRDVNFCLPENGVVQVRSPLSSSGKSTFLKILAGLLEPTEGAYLINGESILTDDFGPSLSYRLQIGYGFEMGGLLNNKTVKENLSLPLEYHRFGEPLERENKIQWLLDAFDLRGVSHLRPYAISGSQRKAICVARAFCLEPQVMILDEPTVGLSPSSVVVLKRLIQSGIELGFIRLVVLASEDGRIVDDLATHWIQIFLGSVDFGELVHVKAAL